MWVFGVLVLARIFHQINCAESIVETICFGDTLTLKCPPAGKLEIYGAFYKLLDSSNQTVCRHDNQALPLCDQPKLTELVQNDCHGKNECLLGYRDKHGNVNCRSPMYLNVIYACAMKTGELQTTKMSGDVFLPITEPLTTTITMTTMNATLGSSEEVYMTLTRLLVQFKIVYAYCMDNQREMIFSAILGVVAGILAFVMLIMITYCWVKCSSRRKGEFDVEVGEPVAEITSPISMTTPVPVKYETVLVTRQNGIPLSETTLSSDTTLTLRGKGQKEHQLISTIKRTHSIDEGTQTDIEEDNDAKNLPTRQLSVQETRELGNLVDSMNYYNQKLYDDDFEYRYQPKTPSINAASEFYYSSTECKPLLEKSLSVDAYSGQDDSSSDGKLHIPQKTFSRNPSELSYTASVSNNSLDFYTTDQAYNSTPLRYNSMQRAIPQPPRIPKPGVRGDGFDFIH